MVVISQAHLPESYLLPRYELNHGILGPIYCHYLPGSGLDKLRAWEMVNSDPDTFIGCGSHLLGYLTAQDRLNCATDIFLLCGIPLQGGC